MDIVETLEREHERLLGLVARYGEVNSVDAAAQLIIQLAQELSVHEIAEEAAVWYELRGNLPNAEVLEEAIAQETELEAALEDLAVSLEAEDLPARTRDLRARLIRHIQNEERGIFPLIRQHIDETRRSEMSHSYDAIKTNLVEQMAKLNVIVAPEQPLGHPLQNF
jgi:hypothetical protein